jgi:catechol 2,3-dioxygenase-like lactoylglutathione lyase family enzyme
LLAGRARRFTVSLSIDAIGHIVSNVADLEVSAAWYVRVLGMERIEFELYTGVRVALRFGNQKINLRPADADTVTWLTGVVPVPGSADLCFVTKLSPDAVKANWVARGIAIEAGPMEQSGARGPMTSVYCRDPDGNLIEVATYP